MKRPVLLVIDMLNDFFRHGLLAERRAALVESINELVALFRSRRWPIVWVRQEFAPDLSDAFLDMRDRGTAITIAGTDGCQLLPELDYRPGDPVIVKKRYSAFFGTNLDDLLAELQPDGLVLAGVNTHACVRTAAVDAYQRDYRVTIAADCVASYDEEYHRVTLRYMQVMAQVLKNAELRDVTREVSAGALMPITTMNSSHLTLVTLAEELRPAFIALAEDYLAAGEDRYRTALEDFQAYLRGLREEERGLDLPTGRVPQSTFWLSAGRRLLGRAALRHRLTPELEHEGGHIGYDIRPSERRKGYGTAILGLALEKAREMGLRRVMLSCDADNIGSAKVIERNGGRLEGRSISGGSGKQISRYWVEL